MLLHSFRRLRANDRSAPNDKKCKNEMKSVRKLGGQQNAHETSSTSSRRLLILSDQSEHGKGFKWRSNKTLGHLLGGLLLLLHIQQPSSSISSLSLAASLIRSVIIVSILITRKEIFSSAASSSAPPSPNPALQQVSVSSSVDGHKSLYPL